nr:MAG TPA: hypothetical protein [Caudoviricetes sp.]
MDFISLSVFMKTSIKLFLRVLAPGYPPVKVCSNKTQENDNEN